jgi:hypothetical protein
MLRNSIVRQGASPQVFILTSVALALALAGLGADAPSAGDPQQVLEREKAEAAMRGVRWLTENRDVLPQRLALVTYRKLYKVTADDSLAGSLLRIIQAIESASPQVETSVHISDPAYRRWDNLHAVLTELVRRRCTDPTYIEEAEEVARLVSRDWDRLFPSRMEMSQKIVAAYLLGVLGVAPDGLYDEAVSEARSQVSLMDDPGSYYYTCLLYALTHIILTESDYYNRYVDPREHEVEVGALDTALRNFLADAEAIDTKLDVAAEVLICLKLLRLIPCVGSDEAFRQLIRHQNPDGSWGQGNKSSTSRIHTTAVATLALIEFAPEFRPGSIFCDSGTYR